ncbi:DUF1631 family protein [Reinekea marina]|uniref:DUF1631 family protein n=1 Tax=Reinekea marina TaxID=1310421 RepID=A0ABV7WUZ7_9GAMM|nr:DUF1631 family protein [Reinekea marina]MDN3647383.1 DUF1631 family protein [Reinekea marina]
MSSNNAATVTSLDQHRRFNRAPDHQRLTKLSDRFCERMPNLMTAFFNHADEFLFNTAEKSVDGFAANKYFDQLRQLRKQKDNLQQLMLHDVRKWVTEGAPKHEEKAEALDDLSLMEDQELERDLAISSFANRVYERAGNEWLAWHERMLAVTCAKKLHNKETPFTPYVFGDIVFKQLESLEFPTKTTLMLFRLFDDKAVNELTDFYQSSNHWLIEEGILPNLKLENARRETPSSIDTSDLSKVAALLSEQQVSGQPNLTTGQGGFTPGPMANAGGVTIDPALLTNLLSSFTLLQQNAAPAATNMDELKQWTSAQVQQVSQSVQGTQESGTISLVAMLFEYILDDDQLSPYMKQLLARMQIPIIKVALLDKSFFQQSEHAARQLLNKMAKAANGWHKQDNVEGDALLTGMEHIVDQLNHDLDDNIEIFSTLLEQFTELHESYRANSETKVRELEQVEIATVEAHVALDRTRVFIDTLMADQGLPEDIELLLGEKWYRLMAAIFKKQGECQAWKTSARIARELVWSFQPSVQMTHGKRFTTIVPKMLSGLQDGLKSIGLSDAERQSIITSIQDQHAINSGALDENIWDAQAKLDNFEEAAEEAERVIEAEIPLPVDEPVQELRQADLSYYLDQVESLALQQWFDIELQPGEVKRGELSLIVGEGAKYIFTDSQGEKIVERSAIGLAMGMRDEVFTPIAEDPLFDRMIDSIVDDIG